MKLTLPKGRVGRRMRPGRAGDTELTRSIFNTSKPHPDSATADSDLPTRGGEMKLTLPMGRVGRRMRPGRAGETLLARSVSNTSKPHPEKTAE